jgi:hypothetical protein
MSAIRTFITFTSFLGYLTSTAVEATLFAHSRKGDKSSYPDIQIHFLSINYDKGLARKYNLNNLNETVYIIYI